MTTLQTPENALEQALVFLRRGNTEAAIGFATVAVQLLSSPKPTKTERIYCCDPGKCTYDAGDRKVSCTRNGFLIG